MKIAQLGFFVVSSIVPTVAYATDPPASPPPPTPSADQSITLNQRVFVPRADVYDPLYGLGKAGYVKEGIIHFAIANAGSFVLPTVTLVTRNFTSYYFNSKEGGAADVTIPVIGSVHANADQVVHVTMEDVSEGWLPTGPRPSTCEVWKAVKDLDVYPDMVVTFTDHVVFSTVTYGASTKQAVDAKLGVGSIFSIGGTLYKEAETSTKVPLISVGGGFFTVHDPKTYCNGTLSLVDQTFHSFRDVNDIKFLGVNRDATPP